MSQPNKHNAHKNRLCCFIRSIDFHPNNALTLTPWAHKRIQVRSGTASLSVLNLAQHDYRHTTSHDPTTHYNTGFNKSSCTNPLGFINPWGPIITLPWQPVLGKTSALQRRSNCVVYRNYLPLTGQHWKTWTRNLFNFMLKCMRCEQVQGLTARNQHLYQK